VSDVCTLVSSAAEKFSKPGTDVLIKKKFSLKNFAKNWYFFAQNIAKLCKNWIITLVFGKTPIFSPKIGKIRREW
jgi:hypothetical protein